MEKTKTIAQEALELLSPIPEDQWIVDHYTDLEGKCCAIGHWMRLKSNDPTDYSADNCCDTWDSDLRIQSIEFMRKHHGIDSNVAAVNNYTTINGYTEPVIKDRVIHLLKDMVDAGY